MTIGTIGAGTSEYTVGSIINRLFATFLTPPDDQYAQFRATADMASDTAAALSIGSFVIPEDEALMRMGTVIEWEQELMRVQSYEQATGQITVARGEYGTVRTPHPASALINLSPPYPRASVFEAVSDNIITLYPKLSTSHAEMLSSVGPNVFGIGDELAVSVLSVQPGDFVSTVDVQGEIVDFHPAAGGRALITTVPMGTCWLRYRRRMGKPTGEDTLISDVGVDPRWVQIVLVGAAADLMAGKDIPASQTEWVKSVLEAESIRVGTRMSIAGGLRQYRNMLLDDASAEMKAEYRPKVRVRSSFNQVAG